MDHKKLTLKILHIDDEEDFLFLTRLGLQNINTEIEIDSILNPTIALQKINSHQYDAIICDYDMESLDGLDLLNKLRENGDNTPFIIVTGKSREEIVIKALNLGVDFYIEKSLDPKVFYTELHHLLITSISKNKNMDALITSESRYRALAESTSVGFWQVSSEGNTMYVNESMRKLIGIKDIEMIYKEKLEKYLIPLDLETETQTFFAKTYEALLVNDKGEKNFGIISSAPVFDTNGELESFIGTFTDITELRLIEKALRESQEQLKREKDELSIFAHMMAHDMRNMLSSIHGYASLLTPIEEDKEIVENIKKVANKSFQFLSRSLELAEAGRIIEKQDKVNLTQIIKETVELVVPNTIEVVLAENFPFIQGDNEKIYQIFKNLLENAVNHGKPTTIQIKYEENPKERCINISNNGTIISDSIRKNLFNGKLKGLGFKIIKKIVDAHGWEIKLLEEENTNFQIILPLDKKN